MRATDTMGGSVAWTESDYTEQKTELPCKGVAKLSCSARGGSKCLMAGLAVVTKTDFQATVETDPT